MSQSERRKATSDDIILELEDAYTKDPGKNVGPLAEAYIDFGRPKDAIRVVEKDGNGQVDTQVLLAKALYDSFQNAKAAETIKAAVAKGNLEKNLRAQLLLGEMAYEENREDEAKKHLKVAFDIDNQNRRAAELLNTLGENVTIPEDDEEQDELVGFSTEVEQNENLKCCSRLQFTITHAGYHCSSLKRVFPNSKKLNEPERRGIRILFRV